MKFETKLNKILAMADSDMKLTKLDSLGLSLGMFDKRPIIDECSRLRALGYENITLKYIRSKAAE